MTTSEDPDSLPEETPDESSESSPDIPVGFSFARICEELGYNPETVKALTLTETSVYATGVDYPEPLREATDHGTD